MADESKPTPLGPPVADEEDVYRAITYPIWWDTRENRPSSAAFDDHVFSVDRVKLTTSPDDTLNRFRPGTGLVKFNCGQARTIGFDTRDEIDDLFPDNSAHAHVYDMGGSPNRKKRARRMAKDFATVIIAPDLSQLGSG